MLDGCGLVLIATQVENDKWLDGETKSQAKIQTKGSLGKGTRRRERKREMTKKQERERDLEEVRAYDQHGDQE